MKETIYRKDASNKKMFVAREFDAPLEDVWQAWTDTKILDQWWAPKPWKARTKSMDFKEGGTWLYYMEGPEGERSWCRVDFKKIIPLKSFEGLDAFCNEEGKLSNEFPSMYWKVDFIPQGNQTKVDIEITYESEADLEKIMELGFEEGFRAAHQNLDELLAKS